MRLQKWIAASGICSRREAEQKIVNGCVFVNGKPITELGTKIDPQCDEVMVDGVLCRVEPFIYILYHKPIGVICTAKDTHGRDTVVDAISIPERVYPVGRLDKDSSGLLILTNDGEFTNAMIHPKYHIGKMYEVIVRGYPDEKFLKKFAEGIEIDGYITQKSKIQIIKRLKFSTILRITLYEGRNRQIRKMCELLGHPVIKLRRVAIGKIMDENLSEGSWRYLKEEEVEELLREVTQND